MKILVDAIKIFMESYDVLLDSSMVGKTIEKINEVIKRNEGLRLSNSFVWSDEAEKLHKPHAGVHFPNQPHAHPMTDRPQTPAFPLLFHKFYL